MMCLLWPPGLRWCIALYLCNFSLTHMTFGESTRHLTSPLCPLTLGKQQAAAARRVHCLCMSCDSSDPPQPPRLSRADTGGVETSSGWRPVLKINMISPLHHHQPPPAPKSCRRFFLLRLLASSRVMSGERAHPS